MHRIIKGGEVPYEDEKYAYLAVTRDNCQKAAARIVRHPYIEKKQISVELCTNDGLKKQKIRKNADQLYKQARKAKWGDSLDHFN
jgi:ribosomal protein RSM22 (predicted rRNA methylase)